MDPRWSLSLGLPKARPEGEGDGEKRTASHPRTPSAILPPMTRIEEIEKAVAELPEEELAKFRAWFEEFDARAFDEKIERDAKAGKLDKLAEAAKADHAAGRRQEI